MFAVIYRGYIKPGCEEKYKQALSVVATYFKDARGAIGSSLHLTEEGYWLAYSRWPDKATRNASWPGDDAPSNELPKLVQQAIVDLQACRDPDRQFPEICMEVERDLLT